MSLKIIPLNDLAEELERPTGAEAGPAIEGGPQKTLCERSRTPTDDIPTVVVERPSHLITEPVPTAPLPPLVVPVASPFTLRRWLIVFGVGFSIGLGLMACLSQLVAV